MTAFLDAQPWPNLRSMPIETVAKVLLPALWETNVGTTAKCATRRPRPDNDEDFPAPGVPFFRIEAGGGQWVDEIRFRQDLIINTYHDDEATAENCANTITGLTGNGLGAAVTLDNGDRWDISSSGVPQLPTRQIDPMVNIVRYRSMVTWTTTGKPIVQ